MTSISTRPISQWCAVRITAVRWEIVDHVPCKFLRPPAMAPLPEPEMGGSEDELHSFARLVDDDFMLAVGWPAGTLNPRGAYPRLALCGGAGGGKTSLARLLRSIIDPSLAPDRAPPRDERGLCLAAKNAWVLALDNISDIPP